MPLLRRFRIFMAGRFRLGFQLACITALFILAIIGMLAYTIHTTRRQSAEAIVIDVAGRQRSLIQKLLGEIVLLSHGHAADPLYTERVLSETLNALTNGGRVVVTLGREETIELPPAPSRVILEKLSEQKMILDRFRAVAEAFVRLPRSAPSYESKLKDLTVMANILRESANDAAKLFARHAQSNLETMVRWQVAIAAIVVVLGILFTLTAKQANDDLEREIHERVRMQWQLAEAIQGLEDIQIELEERVKSRTEELTNANRDLETLLYVISHDLKEPLRAIENFSNMVHEQYADRLDERGHDFLTRVVRGAQRMRSLLDDILLLSRASRISPPEAEIAAEEVVQAALDRLEHMVSRTRAKIRVEPNLPRLQVDKAWATEAVYNLIENALKFTRNGDVPDIEIGPYWSTRLHSGAVGIVVRDRGPGIPADQAERIFRLFQRAVGREIEGTGAGLAIVQQIAERHGGHAWTTPREGGGSEFFVTFGRRGKETANA